MRRLYCIVENTFGYRQDGIIYQKIFYDVRVDLRSQQT